jgi:hypothetical protein
LLAQLAKEDPKKAAVGFERLLASARKDMDLRRQQRIGQHAFAVVSVRDGRPRPGVALPLHKSLGGTKAHAYFSAHRLAYRALFLATAHGDYGEVGPAIRLALLRRSHGKYAWAMREYAAGVWRVRDGAPEYAIPHLRAALEASATHGWSRLALHAGLELLLASTSADDPDAEKALLQDVLASVREDTDIAVLHDGKRLADRRLASGRPKLCDAWSRALDERIKSYRSTGEAAAGGDAPPRGLTPLGKALRKWRKKKALVSVERSGARFEITYAFGKLAPKTHRRAGGVRHVTAGGLTLAFWENGVRLQHVSIDGQAVPGANAAPARWQFFDPLADGETWSLYATGEIRIE